MVLKKIRAIPGAVDFCDAKVKEILINRLSITNYFNKISFQIIILLFFGGLNR